MTILLDPPNALLKPLLLDIPEATFQKIKHMTIVQTCTVPSVPAIAGLPRAIKAVYLIHLGGWLADEILHWTSAEIDGRFLWLVKTFGRVKPDITAKRANWFKQVLSTLFK